MKSVKQRRRPSVSINTSSPTIVFLNRSYWPDTEATGQLLTDLCQHLSSWCDVHVVCGQPNSPKDSAEYLDSGIEVRRRVTIHRLQHTRFAKRIPAGRSLNLLSFTRAASRYLRKTCLAADVVISETDPFLLPIIGARHARRVGARFVSYLQDIYPDVAEAIGKVKPGLVTKQVRSRLRKAYQAADRVVVLGSCMQDRLTAAPWSIEKDKIRIIPNWADCQSIVPVAKEHNPFLHAQGLEDQFVVMHSGNMGLTQRLDVLVEATLDPAWPDDALLLLVGDGAARKDLRRQVEQRAAGRVRFLPYQPLEQLAESLSAADLHVVSMHENITGCLCPSKLYGILAAQRPVLAIAAADTDLHRAVTKHKIGWCCRPGAAGEIAKSVARCVEDRPSLGQAGVRARQIAEIHYDREVVLESFSDMIQELAGTSAAEVLKEEV